MFEPAPLPFGEKAATLVFPVELTLKLLAESEPFNVHANVRASVLASLPFAVKFRLPVKPTLEPVAAGVCEAQVGGVFLTTVQV